MKHIFFITLACACSATYAQNAPKITTPPTGNVTFGVQSTTRVNQNVLPTNKQANGTADNLAKVEEKDLRPVPLGRTRASNRDTRRYRFSRDKSSETCETCNKEVPPAPKPAEPKEPTPALIDIRSQTYKRDIFI